MHVGHKATHVHVQHACKGGSPSLLSPGQLGNALVPAPDNLASTKLELEWLVAGHRGVKHLAICQLASVMD